MAAASIASWGFSGHSSYGRCVSHRGIGPEEKSKGEYRNGISCPSRPEEHRHGRENGFDEWPGLLVSGLGRRCSIERFGKISMDECEIRETECEGDDVCYPEASCMANL